MWFDQTAKYNKEKKKKKPKPQPKENEEKDDDNSDDDVNVESDADSDDENLEALSFTLKQLIRKLHIVEPVEHVMCLIGKK